MNQRYHSIDAVEMFSFLEQIQKIYGNKNRNLFNIFFGFQSFFQIKGSLCKLYCVIYQESLKNETDLKIVINRK